MHFKDGGRGSGGECSNASGGNCRGLPCSHELNEVIQAPKKSQRAPNSVKPAPKLVHALPHLQQGRGDVCRRLSKSHTLSEPQRMTSAMLRLVCLPGCCLPKLLPFHACNT